MSELISHFGNMLIFGALASSCGFVGAYIIVEMRKMWGGK